MKPRQLLTESSWLVACVRSARMIAAAAFLAASSADGVAQEPAALSGGQILSNVEDAVRDIDDLTVTLDVVVDLDRLKVPPMHVTLYLKRPDKVHFESEGFALLPREGLTLGFGRLRSRYLIESARTEVRGGVPYYVLTLKPKKDKSRLQDVVMYVDPKDWTVAQFVAPLSDGRMMRATLEYQEVDHYRLPATLMVVFSSVQGDSTETSSVGQPLAPRRPAPPREGTVTVRYSHYKLNSGLGDDLFERDPKSSKD